MGYSYGHNARGNLVLSCDNCGGIGGVRKRRCPHKVTSEDGTTLPYCPAPAICPVCWPILRATLHAGCAVGAAKSQARSDARALEVLRSDPATPYWAVALLDNLRYVDAVDAVNVLEVITAAARRVRGDSARATGGDGLTRDLAPTLNLK